MDFMKKATVIAGGLLLALCIAALIVLSILAELGFRWETCT